MDSRLKVIIADDSTSHGKNCADKLTSYGMHVLRCKKDGSTLVHEIHRSAPDIVLADVFMPGLDVLGVLSSIEWSNTKNCPMVIAMANCDSPALENEILSAGASYYFIKPFDADNLARRILQLTKSRRAPVSKPQMSSDDFRATIALMMRQIGIPAHLKGYKYIRESVILSVHEDQMLQYMTRLLYPAVANTYHTNPASVERAIRNAIHVAWKREKPDSPQADYQRDMYGSARKPTNHELIASMVDMILVGRIYSGQPRCS